MDNAKPRDNKFESGLKIIGIVVTVASLLFAVAQFTWNQSVEAAKPYLEKKLKWCEEVVETTSVIATSDPATTDKQKQRFWQMYWGVMGMVENKNIVDAMVGFGDALNTQKLQRELSRASLALAHACRQEMADSWSPIWKPSWR